MSLEIIAKNLASKGRNGDSVLVHMTPNEVLGLQQLALMNGTSLSINPYTGMPEAFSLKGIFKGIGNAVKSVLKPIAKIAPFILPFIPGLNALTPFAQSLIAGGIGGLSGGKGFDFKRALLSGVANYGLGSLARSMQAPGLMQPGSFDASGVGTGVDALAGGPSMVSVAPVDAGVTPDISAISGGAPSVPASVSAPVSMAPSSPLDMPGATSVDVAAGMAPPVEVLQTPDAYVSSRAMDEALQTTTQAGGEGLSKFIPDSLKQYLPSKETLSTAKDVAQIGTLGLTGYGAIKSKEELDAQKAEAERVLRNQENEKAADIAYAQQILRDYPILYKRFTASDVKQYGLAAGGRISSYDDERGADEYMGGGIAALAKGGLPPRYLRGSGDGMSDSIRARIGGKQEARLADGEFVVPADVVSHLGNGSSNAGAKKLYAMMDRVRSARTGKKRQAPEVKSERYMPA